MTELEQAYLKNDFSFQTGLSVRVELIYSDVVIFPALQSFNTNILEAIAYWIKDRFTEADKFSHVLPKLTMVPCGQTRYEMGVRLSQTQAVKMLNKINQQHMEAATK